MNLIDKKLWQEAETEIVSNSLKNNIEPFVEMHQYNQDTDVALLFKLTEIELEDPKRVLSKDQEESNDKAKLNRDGLNQAVYNYISEQNKKDEMRKLNIQTEVSSISLVAIENLTPAPISKRFLASIVDMMICLVLTLAYTWVKILPKGLKLSVGNNISNLEHTLLLEFIPYTFKIISCYFIIWFLMQFISLCTIGGTFGCQIMKIAVCNAEGHLLTVRHSLLRALTWSVTILTAGLENVLIFRKDRQTLHDKISKTLVVKLD